VPSHGLPQSMAEILSGRVQRLSSVSLVSPRCLDGCEQDPESAGVQRCKAEGLLEVSPAVLTFRAHKTIRGRYRPP